MNTSQANPAMSDGSKCPQCGAALPAGALAGFCPACLLRQGAAADTAPPPGAAPFTPPSAAELAKLFPQLEILALIGQGGMGAVYKARQKQLDRIVALKILPPAVSHDPKFAERFAREARALAKLNHPNIVTLYEFGQADGLFYFLMEFMDGMNLRQLLNAGRVTPKEALAIVPPICDALQFAHDRGIVHRDIKPENILLSKAGQVKIADFGVAKIVASEPATTATSGAVAPLSAQTDAGLVMGTPQYMAPEQTEHPSEVDHRADIYSLGVVFYQMLTGELPKGKFEPPSKKVVIDVRLDEVVLRALEKEPERRYQQVSEVKTQVETIASTPAANAQTFAEEILVRDYDLDIGSCLRRGWALVWGDFWPVVGVTALILWLLGMVGIIGGPLVGGLCLYFLKKIRREPARVETAFSGFSIALLQLFLVVLVGGALTLVGIACLILPGVYLAGVTTVALTLVIDKQLDFWPALKLSGKTISKHWRKFFGFTVVLALLNLAGLLAFGIGVFLTAPIALAAMMYAYEDIFGQGMRVGSNPPLAAKDDAPAKAARPRVRLEIGGASLAPIFFVVALNWIFAWRLYSKTANHLGQQSLMGIFAWPIFAAPLALLGVLATTILGWFAVSQIRRSAGPTCGLGLAVFDGLLFPLLALDTLIFMAFSTVVNFMRGLPYSASLEVAWTVAAFGLGLLTFALIVWLDFLIVRRVWRAVNKPLAGPPPAVGVPASPGPQPPPKADWTMWSPSQPPLVREINAHLTEAEKREAMKRILFFGFWNAGTFFGPFFFVWFSSLPNPMNWIYGGAVLVVGLAFYPLWLKMQLEFLCTTAWARQQGIKLEQLKRASSSGSSRLFSSLGIAILLSLLVVVAVFMGLLTFVYVAGRAPSPVPKLPPPAAAPVSAPSPLSFGLGITRVVVSRDQAVITGRGSPGAKFVIEMAKSCVTCGFRNDSLFTAEIKRSLFGLGRGLNCLVKDALGNVLLTSGNSEIGPMATDRGRIVFREGTPSPEADGSYVIGEFQPETGAPLPITVRVEKPAAAKISADAQREVLRVQLRQAREAVTLAEARFKTGTLGAAEFQAAKDKVELLEAEIGGDPVQVARVRLAAAQRQLQFAEVRFKAGTIGKSDVVAAKNAVELRQAELHAAEAKQTAIPTSTPPAAQPAPAAAPPSAPSPINSAPATTHVKVGAPEYRTVPVAKRTVKQVVTATGTLNPLQNDPGKWQINALVEEQNIVSVAVGLSVDFTHDAFRDRAFHGKVVQVGTKAVTVQNVVCYDVLIEVISAEPKFKLGMTANLQIIVAQRENVLTIPNAAFRFRLPGSSANMASNNRGPDRTVYVVQGDHNRQPELVRIKAGISDASFTEVTEGLKEGDRVVTGH